MNNQRLFDENENLTERKIEQILRKRAGHALIPLKITGPALDKNIFPLSFAQQRLWFLEQLDPGSASNVISAALRVTGDMHVKVLQQSFQEVIRRHAALRTIFPAENGVPLQRIVQPFALPITVIDMQLLPQVIQKQGLESNIVSQMEQSFSLEVGPLIRVILFRLSLKEHILLVTLHHIIADGWSMGVLLRELNALYTAYVAGLPSPLPALALQYPEFSSWQREYLQGAELDRLCTYWQKQLEGAPQFLDFPADRLRPAVQSQRSSSSVLLLPPDLSRELYTLSTREGVTLFMLLLTAFYVLIYRYSGQEDLVIGSPIANRRYQEVEGLIGLFVNTLMLRVSVADNPLFRELLKRVQKMTLQAYEHQDLPFEILVDRLRPTRSLSYTPLFQIMFILQNAPVGPLQLPGATLDILPLATHQHPFDMSITIETTSKQLRVIAEYSTDLFDRATIQSLLLHYRNLLTDIIANPSQNISDLTFLDALEYQKLLADWSNGPFFTCSSESVHGLFEAQVERTPDKIALRIANYAMTYQGLNRRANQLARVLQSMGVMPENAVGIILDRSIEMILGVLAVLKAGGSYVPIDHAYPRERIAFMISDAHVCIILTQRRWQHLLYESTKTPVVCIDEIWSSMIQERTENMNLIHADHYRACIVYTSGSTGQPKGVQLEHKSIVNLIHSFIESYHPDSNDCLLPVTSISASTFIGEMLPILCAGGTFVLPDLDAMVDHEELVDLIHREYVTIISTVPVIARQLNMVAEQLHQLKFVLCGGEQLSFEEINHLCQVTQVVNGYGLTEAGVCSTWYPIPHDEATNDRVVPIGRPVINSQVYILDKHLNCVPVGVCGEIYVAGTLARGYLNQPEWTAQRFLPHVFSPGERMYRTGDLAKRLPDGNVIILGRVDNQIKIRGFRIEIEEVEKVIIQHPDVSNCAVFAKNDTQGSKFIVAYIQTKDAFGITNYEIYQWMRDRLPDHMLPTAFMLVEQIPLNKHGKVDRQALVKLEGILLEPIAEDVMPQNETERIISSIWQEVLQKEQISIHTSFFDMGGHSLLIPQVRNKLLKQWDKDISLVDLFRYPTVHSLALHLTQTQKPTTFQEVYMRANKQRERQKRQNFSRRNRNITRN